jgi:small-conductance mechanosensitive channel
MKRRSARTIEVVARAREHDWKVALVAGIIAGLALVAGGAFGDVHSRILRNGVYVANIPPRLTAWIAAVVFLFFGIIATRRVAAALGHIVTTQALLSAGAAVRLVVSVVGYLIIIFAELGLLDVSVEHLLVGAGVAGIVLGIAAQQSLGNVFASIVLLLARPFVVGDRIRIRSGALGGIFDATVVGISLTYVTVRTDEGPLKIPNSVMLSTATGTVTLSDEQPLAPGGATPNR